MWDIDAHNYLISLTNTAGRKKWGIIADKMNVKFPSKQFTYDSCRGRYRHTIKNTTPEINREYKEEIEIMNNGQVKSDKLIEMSLEQSKDPQYLLEAHGFCPLEFELVGAKSSQWNHSNKEYGSSVSYASKISVKPIKDCVMTEQQMMEQFNKDIIPFETKSINSGCRNLVIPLADFHWGVTKFIHTEEKLNEMIGIISKGYKTIVIEQLGDLYHSSLMTSSQTQKGTLLEDVNMPEAIQDSRRFYHAIITASLKNAKEVIVEHAAGNHSGNLEYMFLIYLEGKYPQVTVNYHNNPRHAYMLDDVGILLSHGDTAVKKLPMLFPNEYKEIWGASKTTEIHVGHRHTQEKDIDGSTLRQMGTVKPNDLYEIVNGWTTNKKVIQLIEYSSGKAKTIYEV